MPRLKKETAQLKAVKLNKALRKHKGSQSSLAKELGVTRGAINHQIKKNPELLSLRRQAINKAMERAGLTEEFVYGKLANSMKAKAQASYLGTVYQSVHPDHRVIQSGVNICLELFEHRGADIKEESKPTEIHVHYGHRTKPPKKEDDDAGT